MDAENWLPVVGFEGYYEVSDQCRGAQSQYASARYQAAKEVTP